MTDLPDFFRHNGKWHACESPTRSLCGIEPLDPPRLVTPQGPEDVPPEPCITCLGKLWLDEVDADTLDDCRERGFEVSGPIDLPVD